MQSPYRRQSEETEVAKRRALLAEKSRYRAACYLAFFGLLCLIATFTLEAEFIALAVPLLSFGLLWRSEVRRRLLERKGLTWRDVPWSVVTIGWMDWYEKARDRTAVAKQMDDIPPEPGGMS